MISRGIVKKFVPAQRHERHLSGANDTPGFFSAF